MEINLKRPLCFFDLETTGVNVVKDRIVEISIIKILPNNQEESKTWLINPEIKIPKVVSAIHGITDEMVKDKPNFKEFSNEIYEFIEGCDLAGFNSNKFDIPLLAEELLRSEIDFDLSKIKTIDVQNIFHKMEKRTLSAAYKFYCGKEHEDAHSSMSDTRVTYEVFLAQLDRYNELKNDINFLSDFSSIRKSIDLAGFIYENDQNKAVFSFGKYKNEEIDKVIENDPGYFSWILKSDFPNYTKKILNQLRLNKLNNKLK